MQTKLSQFLWSDYRHYIHCLGAFCSQQLCVFPRSCGNCWIGVYFFSLTNNLADAFECPCFAVTHLDTVRQIHMVRFFFIDVFSFSFLFLSHFFLSHHRLYPLCAFSVSCAPLVITYVCVWVHYHLRFIARHPIYTYNIHKYCMDMRSTVNVHIQYISITTLIISVINKLSIIEKIGSLLWPLHRSSTLSASGSDFTGNVGDIFFS